ncbi:MAG: hypothetical protein LAP13_04540 [Acidobacteriia bacterium]|nr:hypothetical protein [Terriglobia bacterium]
MGYKIRIALLGTVFLCAWSAAVGSAAEVRGRVSVIGQNGALHAGLEDGVVLWLTPLPSGVNSEFRAPGNAPHRMLVQKNKHFNPHVLAVQVGLVVDFPNHDPFFHNVFSLFNGKRFDLGLYEAGATRSVHFDRAGICYIFCNIHPQMSAVVVVVDTPYFTLANDKGEYLISSVPAGNYRLNVWEERCTPEALKELSREVVVGQGEMTIGSIELHESRRMVMLHPDKYGKSYDPQIFSSPIYAQP